MKKYFFVIVISARIIHSGFTQPQIDLSKIVDELVSVPDEDLSYEDIYENLMQHLSNPVDLNKATTDDLRQIYILDEQQIRSFITYRDSIGMLMSIYELQVIPSFDEETIERLLPFIEIRQPGEQIDGSLAKRISALSNAFLLLRYERTIETRRGSKEEGNSKFIGSPDKMYLRFRSSKSSDYSIGFTAEKDIGEKLGFYRGYYGVDFLSYHVQIKNKNRIKNIILGDYQAQFGQGLILGGAFGLGKGGETITTIRRSNAGFTPYTSANEAGYYRGLALTYRINRYISFSSFYSLAPRSGNLSEDDSLLTASSLSASGLHRTVSELENRHSLKEQCVGGIIQFESKQINAGISAQYLSYNIPIQRKETLFNKYSFHGESNFNIGGFINYSINNYTFFGEFAQTINHGNALVAGVLTSLHSNFDLAALYRSYQRDYQPFYSNAFSESTNPKNERGIYFGWKYKWSKQISISGYMDYFVFPWLGFRRYAPSDGYEWLARLNYQPTRKIITFLQYREESKAKNANSEGNNIRIENQRKQNIWGSASITVSDVLKLNTRVQYSQLKSFNAKTTQGLAISQDIQIDIGKLKLSSRYALFDTDNSDNRQYIYESDAFMAFSLPAYDGRGIRNYIMLEYKVTKYMSLWARYARSFFTDKNEIGSGPDLIAGNRKNDIKFQALIRF